MKVRESDFSKKLREFITTRLALQEMLIVAHVETKEHGHKNIKLSNYYKVKNVVKFRIF